MPSWLSIPAAGVLSALAVLLGELVTRHWVRRRGKYYVWAPRRRTYQRLDAQSLPRLPALARFEVNGDGERGGPVPEGAADCYRLIALGASSTECQYLDQDSTWPAFAEAFLNEPRNLELLHAEGAHVGNLGRSLANCGHLDLILEKVLPNYSRLDAIVVMTGAGDIVRWLSQKAPAVAQDEPADLDAIFDEHPEKPFAWRRKDFALRRLTSAALRRLRRKPDVHLSAGLGIGRARAMRASAQEIIDSAPDALGMLERFEESLRRLLARAQRSARTVIVVRPCWVREAPSDEHRELGWMFAAGDLRSEEVRAWYSHGVADRLLDQIDRRIASVAREMGVPELDPKPLLDPGFAHFYDETHLAPAGCRIVGEAVAQAVLRERKGRFGSALRPVASDRHADVA
ncbi:MAG: hypothetical protein ACKVXR_04450 [Planctomycetota bacterium]